MSDIVDKSEILHELTALKTTAPGVGWVWGTVNGTTTKIYTKYLTGTTDADNNTIVAHGIADYTKILNCVCIIRHTNTRYYPRVMWQAANLPSGFYFYYTATDVDMSQVGANLQGQPYRIKLEYYL